MSRCRFCWHQSHMVTDDAGCRLQVMPDTGFCIKKIKILCDGLDLDCEWWEDPDQESINIQKTY